MKTTLDSADKCLSFLNVLALKSIITGGVFHQDERPVDSDLEDVCVNSPSVGNTNVQRAVINVNIYVSDLERGSDKVYRIPNRSRLKIITDKVVELLGGTRGVFWSDGELLIEWISNPQALQELNQHTVNIRCIMKMHANYN